MKVLLYITLIMSSLYTKDYTHLKEIKFNDLTAEEERVIVHKGTERPFTGKYNKHAQEGVYTCKRCDTPLYKSNSKFKSSCGWPSFDDEIKGAVKRITDTDGRRIEILCANCDAHLGHVFEGEGFTSKNIRHCVNSISLNFEKKTIPSIKKAYFAGGCFWGLEHYFEKLKGVKSVESGYMGGDVKNPTYMQVIHKKTGHLEVVEIMYDSRIVSYEALAKLFFEIHDPTQVNGQGPDIGEQYLSAVFTSDKHEKEIFYKLVKILNKKGLDIATTIREIAPFYKAEEYHQNYYEKTGKKPYCHSYKKLFKK